MLQSADPRDKLLAAVNYGRPITGKKYPKSYLRACSSWFGRLSWRDREIALLAAKAYRSGKDDQAKKIAAWLPLAPKCPDLD